MSYCPKFCQLIIRKIIRIVATRCQICTMYKIRFRLGLRPRPHLGSLQRSSAGRAYSAPLTPWLHLRGPTFKGRGRGGKVNKGEKEGLKRSLPPNLHHRSTPLSSMFANRSTQLLETDRLLWLVLDYGTVSDQILSRATRSHG